MSEIVELMAKAIAAEQLGLDGMKWDDCHSDYQEDRRRMARAALKALKDPPDWVIRTFLAEGWDAMIDRMVK